MSAIERGDVIRAAEEQAEAYRNRPFSERVVARADFMETLDAYVVSQIQEAAKAIDSALDELVELRETDLSTTQRAILGSVVALLAPHGGR